VHNIVNKSNNNYSIRQIETSDYSTIISKLNSWWGERNMTEMLPRLFFKHFNNTSFIIESSENEILGFIIGFKSQVNLQLGYVHFIGVNPKNRGKNLGRTLYDTFISKMKALKITQLECVTSTKNINSIKFHKKLGFEIKEGKKYMENGISYHENYDGTGEDRVVFTLKIK